MWRNDNQNDEVKNIGLKELLWVDEEEEAAKGSRTEQQHVLCRSLHNVVEVFRRMKLDAAGEDDLSEGEIALYDRQIRIWGVLAQRRLNKSHVFVSGLNGTLVEFCKNVVLAGVGRLTINDDCIAAEDSLLSEYSLGPPAENLEMPAKSIAEVCSGFLKDINPMIHISIERGDLSRFGVNFFKDFNAVVVSCCAQSTKKLVNEKCRKLSRNIAFFSVHCRGSCGEIFIDMHNHYYSKETKKQTESTQYELKYPSFEEAISVPWRSLEKRVCPLLFAMRVIDTFEQLEGRNVLFADLPRVLELRKELCENQSFDVTQIPDILLSRLLAETTEFPPVCSILGGVLAQEVIKAVSGKGIPLKNFFFFDAKTGKGVVEDISPTEIK